MESFARWPDGNPEVLHNGLPARENIRSWFKRFPGLTVCGEGELIKTFLRLGHVAEGEEVV